MLDATGKFPDGILQGNLNALGSYSSCLEIEARNSSSPPFRTFSGKFGGVQFGAKSFNPLYGICLPSTCSDDDFYEIVYTIDIAINKELRFIWIPKLSVANETYELDGGEVLMM